MGEIVHRSHIRIVREQGPTRRALIEGFDEPIYYGVHSGIKEFYKVEPKEEHAATLDHIVAATAGWMMGTLATLLAGRSIPTHEDLYSAVAEGIIENVDGVPRITRIDVTYNLKVSRDKVTEAKEAFEQYLPQCPAASSVRECIDISDHLELEETD